MYFSRPLTILLVADPFAPVGIDAVGGAEQVLSILERGLAECGHQTLVVAAEGSMVAGELIASPAGPDQWDGRARECGLKAHKEIIRRALARHPVDIVHLHGLHFYRYLPGRIPVLTTLHLPYDFYPEDAWVNGGSHVWLNCVSASQHEAFQTKPCSAGWIMNGVDVNRFEHSLPKPTRPDFALALGRICPEKGFHLAIEAAKMADVDLLLAGQVFPYQWHRLYFAQQIAPRLDDRRRFVGPLGFDAKRRMLAQAKCLLVPSMVAETSSLVAMEALASGTPVIAFRSGALPEIVEHGRTGYIVSNAAEMAEAISAVAQIDPEECRHAAGSRFPAETMIQAYAGLYHRIASKT